MATGELNLEETNRKIWDELLKVKEATCAAQILLLEKTSRILAYESVELERVRFLDDRARIIANLDLQQKTIAELNGKLVELQQQNENLTTQNKKFLLELKNQTAAVPTKSADSLSPPKNSCKCQSSLQPPKTPMQFAATSTPLYGSPQAHPDVVPEASLSPHGLGIENLSPRKENIEWVSSLIKESSTTEIGPTTEDNNATLFSSCEPFNTNFKDLEARTELTQSPDFKTDKVLEPIGSHLEKSTYVSAEFVEALREMAGAKLRPPKTPETNDNQVSPAVLNSSSVEIPVARASSVTPTSSNKQPLLNANKTTPGKRPSMAVTLRRGWEKNKLKEDPISWRRPPKLCFDLENDPITSNPALSKDLLVKGLSKNVTPQDVLQFFSEFGRFVKFKVPIHSRNLPDGAQYMFISFQDTKTVDKILKRDFYIVKERKLQVLRGRLS